MTKVSTSRVLPALGLALGLALSLAWPGAQAQALDDPTRPPAALWAPANAAPVVAARPQLQSVLISTRPGGRRLAVIDGQVVRVGSKVGNAVVMEIHDTTVLLRRGKSLETFKLYPSSKTDRKQE
ncbi:MSHA biogenesis protein MshK [Janthinobacterium sp. ROICE36]|uniref:MSHA biogenesis protein MshK n=1 Tax=Janthinobacterium sp. ROICE36 TaxID=2048670 RepID=UPI002155F137|nr:MSHA biogenesis protein MshK [Janthinobacterium sp. ROICE36]